MKIGDFVLTNQGEEGKIVSEWDRGDEYHWWVDIYFVWRGKERICKTPFRQENLTVIEEKNVKN